MSQLFLNMIFIVNYSKSTWIFILLILVCVFSSEIHLAYSAEDSCILRLYNNKHFRDAKSDFVPEETLYLYFSLEEVESGSTIRIDWIKPDGTIGDQYFETVEKKDRHNIYQKLIKFEFNKKGPVSSAFSSQSYSGGIFGTWEIRLYIDNVLCQYTNFNLT